MNLTQLTPSLTAYDSLDHIIRTLLALNSMDGSGQKADSYLIQRLKQWIKQARPRSRYLALGHAHALKHLPGSTMEALLAKAVDTPDAQLVSRAAEGEAGAIAQLRKRLNQRLKRPLDSHDALMGTRSALTGNGARHVANLLLPRLTQQDATELMDGALSTANPEDNGYLVRLLTHLSSEDLHAYAGNWLARSAARGCWALTRQIKQSVDEMRLDPEDFHRALRKALMWAAKREEADQVAWLTQEVGLSPHETMLEFLVLNSHLPTDADRFGCLLSPEQAQEVLLAIDEVHHSRLPHTVLRVQTWQMAQRRQARTQTLDPSAIPRRRQRP